MGFIAHFDRGGQICSCQYGKILKTHKSSGMVSYVFLSYRLGKRNWFFCLLRQNKPKDFHKN